MKCFDCDLPAVNIGYYSWIEKVAQERINWDSDEPEFESVDVPVRMVSFVVRCANGHSWLVDSAGYGLEANHQLEQGFHRLADDPERSKNE